MNKELNLLSLIIFLCYPFLLTAGGIKGYITDTKGNDLAFATIYVKETGTGTTANENAYYQFKLPPGSYTVIYQYLGYQSVQKTVIVDESFTKVDVALKPTIFKLDQVVVDAGREDPAYTVMRKAIAKAKYHTQQLDTYSAQVYMKGSGRMLKSPWLFRRMMKKNGMDSSFAFVQESVSEVSYTRPNTFKEKVISIRTVGEDNSTSPLAYINGSFYQSEIAGAISPLSPKAFYYYRFELEGTFADQGQLINKIKVTPRSRGDKVFSGYINIVEDYWSIHSLDLSTYQLGIKFSIQQIYKHIHDLAWMPISHKFDADGKVMGFGFEYDYLATVKDYKITLNPDLDVEFEVIDEKIEKDLASQLEKSRDPGLEKIEEKLEGGKELTRKELRKMMKEYEKQEQESSDEPEVISNTTFKVDSLAYKRDSTYWDEIRSVPLTQYELKGYHKMDSVAIVEKKESEGDSLTVTIGSDGTKVSRKSKFGITDLLTGATYNLGGKTNFTISPILATINYNTVEGYSLYYDFALTKRLEKKRRISFEPTVRYAFSRGVTNVKGAIKYDYGERLKRNNLTIQGGRYVFQLNNTNSIAPVVNTFMATLFETSYLKLYEKDYLGLTKKWTAKENLSFFGGIEWSQRRALRNSHTKPWINNDDKQFSSNRPYNLEYGFTNFDTHQALVANIGARFLPWQRYRIRNNRKRIVDNSSPIFTMEYRKGIADVLSSDVNFDHIDIGVKHIFEIGVKARLHLKANAGKFLNKKKVEFIDYKHFAGNRTPFVTADPVSGYRLLDYYAYSTGDEYITGSAHYQMRQFLFTQIVWARIMGIKEDLFVNYLYTPTSDNYMELGYSIENIYRIFRLELATSWQDGQYKDWGILIGVSSNLTTLFN